VVFLLEKSRETRLSAELPLPARYLFLATETTVKGSKTTWFLEQKGKVIYPLV
jgi:hypothetical protein